MHRALPARLPFRAALVLLALVAHQATTSPAAAQDPTPGAGTWIFVPDASDQLDEKVNRAVAHMNFLIRGIAKRRLKGANEPIDRIEIRYSADSVYVTLRADEPPVVSKRDGTFGPYRRADGEVVQVKTELSADVLDQFFDSEDGDKRMVYRMRPDGTLALEVEVISERLREPFKYTWVFRHP